MHCDTIQADRVSDGVYRKQMAAMRGPLRTREVDEEHARDFDIELQARTPGPLSRSPQAAILNVSFWRRRKQADPRVRWRPLLYGFHGPCFVRRRYGMKGPWKLLGCWAARSQQAYFEAPNVGSQYRAAAGRTADRADAETAFEEPAPGMGWNTHPNTDANANTA